MEYVILWIMALLTSLLLTALATALFSLSKRKLWRHLGMLTVLGGLTFLFGFCSLFTGLMYYNNLIIPSWLFPYATSYALTYLIVAVVIWRKGLVTKEDVPPARAWRRSILAACLFLGITLTMTTYTLIDVNRQIEFTNVNCDLKTRLQRTWPSKPLTHLNAYSIYEQASKALNTEDNIIRILDYNKPDQQAIKPEIMELVERNQKALDLLHQASIRPFYFWGTPLDKPPLWLFQFPKFPSYLQLAGLLGLKAKAEVISGDSTSAVNELTVIKSMAKHLQSSPDSLSWLISQAVTKQRFDFMEYLLAQMHSVNGLFKFPIDNTPSILQSCKGLMVNEAAIEFQLPLLMMQKADSIENFIQSYDEMFKSFGAAPPMVLPYILHPLPRSLWRVFIGQSYLSNVKDRWETINQITEPTYKHWRDFSPLKAEIGRKRESLLYHIVMYFENPLGIDDRNTAILIIFERMVRLDVYHLLMDVAVAAAAYGEARGSYPETLDELVPGFLETVPIDPYDGKPLKIKKVQGGLDLYSIGPVTNDTDGNSGERKAIHFYLGKQAYEEYRIKPARLKRKLDEEKRQAFEKMRKRQAEKKPERVRRKKKKR